MAVRLEVFDLVGNDRASDGGRDWASSVAQAIQIKDDAHSKVVEGKDQELDNAKKKINLSKVVLKKSQEHVQLLQDEFDSLLAASKLRQANDATHTKDLEASLATLQNAAKIRDTELKEEKDRHAQAIQDKENSHVNALQEKDDAHVKVVEGKDRELKDHQERAQKLKEDVEIVSEQIEITKTQD